MRLGTRNTATLVVLTAYVLAGTVGHWFHTCHGEHAGGHGDCACESVGPHHCEHHSPALFPSHSHAEGTCPVCKFLAQKSVPPADVAEVTSTRVEEEIVRAEPVRRAGTVRSTYHSRAPPAVA